jgi:hypothetical protein
MSHPYGFLAALALVLLPGGHTVYERAAAPGNRVTILYDAFGKPSRMNGSLRSTGSRAFGRGGTPMPAWGA